MKTKGNRFFLRCLLILVVAAIGVFAYAIFFEPYHIEIRQVQIFSEKLPASFPGLKIVQVSDLHLYKWSKLYRDAVARINQQQADLVVITGDLLVKNELLRNPGSPQTTESIANIIRLLTQLTGRYGLYLCRGNAEFVDHKELSNLFLEKIENAGFNVLANEHVKLSSNGTVIYVLGADFSYTSRYHVADFSITRINGDQVFASGPSRRNAYSHWVGNGAVNWQNYEYTGRLMLRRPDKSGIGITFYSKMVRGYDQFYRLRCYPESASMSFAPHGTTVAGVLDTGIIPEPDQWYRFKIQVETLAPKIVMRARIWNENSAEPLAWQALAYDSTSSRITSGTIGLWSTKRNYHYFDDLRVLDLETGAVLFEENFNDENQEQNPEGWCDFGVIEEGIRAASYGVPDSAFKILLCHAPDYVIEANRCGIDLMLCGHTHGGQVRLPWFGAPLLRTKLGRKFTSGLFQFDNTRMYINRGLGTVIMPVRFMARPEITVINILPGVKIVQKD